MNDDISLPKGFRAAGVAAGLKLTGAPDLAIIVNDGPRHDGAAVFTTNRFEAAPVTWSREVVKDGRVDAVVVNSGGANACTGSRGFIDAHHTAEKVAVVLGLSAVDVIVCSTGIIGELLPMDRLLPAIDRCVGALTSAGHARAARAIMTTDTVPKQAALILDGWSVSGMAKGAGMLAPALATMLVVVTTDAVTTPRDVDTALRTATEVTFDRVDSDGCQSTNDTVLLLASGASGVAVGLGDLTRAVTAVCADLARQLINDAEGARHDVEIDVRSAVSIEDALEVGRAIARNALVKCAIFGGDPNWGRILAAIGTTSAQFEPDRVDVSMNGVKVCKGGAPGTDRSRVSLAGRPVRILVDLHAGIESATIWTNDLTTDYVHENSAYSS